MPPKAHQLGNTRRVGMTGRLTEKEQEFIFGIKVNFHLMLYDLLHEISLNFIARSN
jgi:hypothetical protein